MDGPLEAESLLDEQLAYYRAIAPEYEEYAIPGAWGREPRAALDRFGPAGDVLELACGPGTWTRHLLRHATSILALDASSEMLAIASERIPDLRVRFVQADIFNWKPQARYDVVFFGFWLSHVPTERFRSFWELVANCLRPGGRVFFIDDAHRTPDELVYGESSQVVRRRRSDGNAYHVIKVPHQASELERRLRELGWEIKVTTTREPFYWGAGSLRPSKT
jgi:SAM-dependent methyltransferase